MYHNVRIQSEQCPCAAQVGRIASYGAIRTEGCKKPHPAIIVSNDELQEDEELRDAALEHSRKSMASIIARYL